MATVYEIARVMKLPGVVSTATLFPEELTPRMRKAVARIITRGVFCRWTYSNAQRLALSLIKHVGVSDVVYRSGSNIVIPTSFLKRNDRSVFDKLEDLYRRSVIARKLSGKFSAYDERYVQQDLACLRGDTPANHWGLSLSFYDEKLTQEAYALVSLLYTDEDREKMKAALDIFMKSEPIQLNLMDAAKYI